MAGLFNSKRKVEAPSAKETGGALFKPSSTTTETKPSSGALFKPSGVTMPTEKDQYDTTSTDRSISNAKMRIQSAGGELDKDPRNWLERGLNLPEKQNWLFDTLDVINRPQQALFGAVDAVYDKNYKDIGKQALEGVKGNERRKGSDFIDPFGKLAEEYTGINPVEKLGLDEGRFKRGALGLAVDIASDPTNLIPAGLITKGASVVTKPIAKGLSKLSDTVPAVQSVKDGLGSMFKYQYGWDDTLKGGKDDAVKDLFDNTQNLVRTKSDDALKNVTDQARAAGGYKTGDDVGRILEKDLESTFVGPSPATSSDPKIVQAADNIMKSNNEIRQWANDSGVEIDELQGYMTHILSSEERKFRKTSKGKSEVLGGGSFGMKPNKNILNQRKYEMSATQANETVGRKMFDPNAYFATAMGQKRLIEYVGAKKFMDDVLGNPSFAKKKDDFITENGSIPEGLVTIKPDQFKFFKVDLDDGKSFMGVAGGTEYVVTPGVKQALERFNQVSTDQGIKSFLRGVDKIQGMWKRLTLLSGPYHIRNDIGAKYNNYVGGMNVPEITKYSLLADKEVVNAFRGIESPLYKEFKDQGLGSSSQLAVDLARAGDTPEKAIEKAVKDQSKSKLRRGVEKANPLRVFQTSQELGVAIDQTNRLALYKWAKDKGMSPKDAARKVREVQFDYTRTTNAEREIFTRFAPFYRWSRNNIPFQIRQFVNDPKKYARTDHLYDGARDSLGMDEENTPEFMKENFYLPVSGDGEGGGKMLGLNLPAADLTKLSNPGKLALDTITPAIKTPIEMVTNRNFFFNNEIESFKGEQKKYRIPEEIYGVDIPGGGKELGGLPVKAAYGLEQAGGQPVRGLSRILAKQTVAEKENEALKPSLGISAMLKKYDINKENFYKKKNELRELMDYIDYLEQEQGQRPKTISQIKKGL